ncbi:MAG: MotA/TolQ/ExbB proton channel family protein [Solirubrobacteraceae bacterium]
MPVPYAFTTHDIDQAIYHVANALQIPVLILALLALALVIYELGAYLIELRGRRRRVFSRISSSAEQTRRALLANDRSGAAAAVRGVARSQVMADTLAFIVKNARTAGGDHQINKALADFDFDSQRRLGRTRILVRAGPALGLMGTLIPLSPALTGLANGNTTALSENLRVAFSVTVVGLLVGAVAFAISLSRDRMYGQDLSDLEYVAAIISDPTPIPLGDAGNGHDGERRQASTGIADPSPTGGQQ